MTDDPSGTYQWVPRAEVAEWELRGWSIVPDQDCHHNHYSILMELPTERCRSRRLWIWGAMLAIGAVVALALEALFG